MGFDYDNRSRREREVDDFKSDIARTEDGRKFTPEALREAAEFAADSFKGSVNVGQAREIGIRHVKSRIYKETK